MKGMGPMNVYPHHIPLDHMFTCARIYAHTMRHLTARIRISSAVSLAGQFTDICSARQASS